MFIGDLGESHDILMASGKGNGKGSAATWSFIRGIKIENVRLNMYPGSAERCDKGSIGGGGEGVKQRAAHVCRMIPCVSSGRKGRRYSGRQWAAGTRKSLIKRVQFALPPPNGAANGDLMN